jgi:hypothetical protein
VGTATAIFYWPSNWLFSFSEAEIVTKEKSRKE